ncbi:MAG TPA: hypothetical protein PK782_14355 [Nitrospira sp.]|nr:hypothetical protein [Rhodocyclaceae bacterium]HND03256.1 hypothetical protein [Nitrospira sp.]HNG03884.1 hypothetical protein [Nitrospira sp.]
MKSIALGPFIGVNNRLPDFSLETKDGAFVRSASNVEVDNAGRLRRRRGLTLIQAMTGAHSIFMVTATTGFLVRASALYSFDVSGSYAETLVKTLTSNARVYWETWNGDSYYSNGTDSGRVSAAGAWFPWGMETPAVPAVTTIAGTLEPGNYQVALTYTNTTTGEEGGCAGSTLTELTAAGGLRVTLPGASPGATHINVYCSPTNGGVPLLQATVAIGTAYRDITGSVIVGRQCQTMYEEPLPAGTQVALANGRLCCASGSRVFVGEPFRPGYYLPSEGYIDFEAAVTNIVPAQGGTYIVADKTRWFAGTDLMKPDMINDVLPYGGVAGTRYAFPNNSRVGWFGERGWVVADPGGQAEAAMSDNIDMTPPASGFAVVLSDDGFHRVMGCGWTLNLETLAATETTISLTSASSGYGTRPDGVYQLVGSKDGALDIPWSVGFGKLDFGTEEHKRLPAVYVGASSENPVVMTVTLPNGDSWDYEARTRSDGVEIHRIDPGKGLRANWFALALSDVSGGDILMASISFGAAITTRKI